MQIISTDHIPAGFDELLRESAEQGFRFLLRLEQEWQSGMNRFSLPGEVLLAAMEGNELLGIGGLNRDPYSDHPSIGRVRHLYVRSSARRRGVGRALIAGIMERAKARFNELRLRTDAADACRFYERIGFLAAPASNGFTHRLHLSA